MRKKPGKDAGAGRTEAAGRTRAEARNYYALVKIAVRGDYFCPTYRFLVLKGRSLERMGRKAVQQYLERVDECAGDALEDAEFVEERNTLQQRLDEALPQLSAGREEFVGLESSICAGWPTVDLEVLAEGTEQTFPAKALSGLDTDPDFRGFLDSVDCSPEDDDPNGELAGDAARLCRQFRRLHESMGHDLDPSELLAFLEDVCLHVFNDDAG